MNGRDKTEQRIERAVFETDRQLVVGNVTLPPHGYQGRFSDMLNRREFEFLALTDVEITSLDDGSARSLPFAVIAKAQVRLAYPFSD